MHTLYIDCTSSNGRWNWKLPDDDPTQPELVRITTLLWNHQTPGNLYCRLIKPETSRRVIDPLDVPLLNIDDEDLHTNGHTLWSVMARVRDQIGLADEVVMFNAQFHQKMVGRAWARCELVAPPWPAVVCLMQRAQPFMTDPKKWPRMAEAYAFLTKEALMLSAQPVQRGIDQVMAIKEIHCRLLALTGPAAA